MADVAAFKAVNPEKLRSGHVSNVDPDDIIHAESDLTDLISSISDNRREYRVCVIVGGV